MSNAGVHAEVADYAARVRAALSELPPDQRDELLDDLEQHLTEVAQELAAAGGAAGAAGAAGAGDRAAGDRGPTADGGAPDGGAPDAGSGTARGGGAAAGWLAARLGPPERYAAELRASAGLGRAAGSGARRAAGRRRWFGAPTAARRLVESDEGRRVVAFLPELRPGWWVLRGLLAAYLLGELLLRDAIATVLLAVLAVPASVLLGRRTPTGAAGRRRWAVVAGNVAAAVVGLVATSSLLGRGSGPVVYQVPTNDAGSSTVRLGPGTLDGAVTNIYPYDANGRPLSGVYLYDQDGNPVELGDQGAPDGSSITRRYPYDADGTVVTNVFPQDQAVGGTDDSGNPVAPHRVAPPRPVVPRLSPPVAAGAPAPTSPPATARPAPGSATPGLPGSGSPRPR